MSNIERSFTLRSVFTDVSKMKTPELKISVVGENHYGFPFKLRIQRSENGFGVFLYCHLEHENGWLIQVEYVFECISVTGETTRKTLNHEFSDKKGWGFNKFLDWSELIEKYIKDDKIEVKCHVTIKKVTGLDKKPLAIFDESMEKFSDVVVKVGAQKFYVSKSTVARHSPYFEAMFFGNFEEAKKSEIELKEVDPQDFQDYLELLHAESPISDLNVEKLLEFADMYDTPLVIKKCTEHLMTERCKLSRRDKIRLGAKFRLKNLVDQCVSECKTLKHLRDMLSDDITDFDPKILKNALDMIFENVPMDWKLS